MTCAEVLLGDVISVDARVVAPEAVNEGDTYVGLESIKSDGALDECVTVSAGELKSAKFAFDSRHVLFGKLRPNLGKVTRPSSAGVCSTDIYPLLPGDRIDRDYLAHFLLTPTSIAKAASRTTGVNLPRINARTLLSFVVPLPPLPEQRRIAAILDQADELRAKRRRALACLDELERAIFSDVFGDASSNERAWKTGLVLSDVAEVVSGITKGRKAAGIVRQVPYLTVANVQDKSLKLDVVKKIDATDREIERYRLKHGDLLLTEGGDPDKLGRGVLWREELPESIHQNHVFRVRVFDWEAVNPLFLNWLVGSAWGKSYFLRAAKQTTGIASINSTQLRAFPLVIPRSEVQGEFARRMRCVDVLRADLRAHLAKLDELFTSLQHRAFNGEL